VRARDNPFRTDRVLAVRYRLAGDSWEALLARFDALGRRAALVGPQGSGKTTLLEDLAPRFRARGYSVRELRLDTEMPRFEPVFLEEFIASLTPRDIVLFERRTRAAAGLLITLHRPGRLPTLLETRTSPELLAGLIEQILGSASSDVRDSVPELYRRHEGNLREALRELYDRYAGVTV
jgi:Fe-S cluster assembly ATPase SufC